MPFWNSLYGRFKNWIGGLFPSGAAKREFDASTAISREMESDIAFWYRLYLGEPPWKTHDVISLNIPSAICREMVRPTLSELEVKIDGGAIGTYLMDQFETAKKQLSPALETFLALGGGVLKPFIFGDKIVVQYCSMTSFQPTVFNSAGECVGAVFKEVIKSSDNKYYARMENHKFEGGKYIIENKAFESSQSGTIGNEVDINKVPEWPDIKPAIFVENVERPLFAYFKTPMANKADPNSGVGLSVYAEAIELIRQADVQWERIQWEFKSGERKIFGDRSQTNIERFGKDRLYAFGPFNSQDGDLLHEFSPDFRDSNLYDGFQNILKQIEFNVGLSFGTISDPQSVEKTATEIESTKQRMYTTIEAIKRNFQKTLDDLIYAMSVYSTLYNLAPAGNYEVTFEWGDSILEDTATKQLALSDMRNDVAAGILRPELYIMKKYGVTEEEALAMMPGLDDLTTETQEEVE